MSSGSEIERLIQLLAKLPGLGPRSARRAALVLLKKRDLLLEPLATAMQDAAAATRDCEICGNLDTISPCAICRDPAATRICSVWWKMSPISGPWNGQGYFAAAIM